VPNIRAMSLTDGVLRIVSADGTSTFEESFASVKAFYDAASGNPAQKRSATINWLLGNLEAALGVTMVNRSMVTEFEFDSETGMVLSITFRSLTTAPD
jgi:hypothetical protein